MIRIGVESRRTLLNWSQGRVQVRVEGWCILRGEKQRLW
jgi:hypothetical protein